MGTTPWTRNTPGSVQTFTAPTAGYYKLETWGADGGTSGGKGGYSCGTVYLDAGQIFYVYIGGSGGAASNAAYNGGTGTVAIHRGGGATDIRLTQDPTGTNPTTAASLRSRIMAAGGGGGNGTITGSIGGAGGGLTGKPGSDNTGLGGTQVAGGTGGSPGGAAGALGVGGAPNNSGNAARMSGGGGGGWYGGGSGVSTGAGSNTGGAGGGGSGYVLTADSDKTGYTGGSVPNEKYFMIDAVTLSSSDDGFVTNPNGSGNNLNGYARITQMEEVFLTVNITDELPDGLEYISSSHSGSYSSGTHTVTWIGLGLDTNKKVAVSVTAKVSETGTFENTATAFVVGGTVNSNKTTHWAPAQVQGSAPITVTLKALKKTTGGTMNANQFDFSLQEIVGGSLKGSPKTAKNTSAGSESAVIFATLTFEEEGAFVYLLRETDISDGTDDGWQGDWKLDDTCYKVVITVSENSSNELTAAVEYVEVNRDGSAINGKTPTTYTAVNDATWPVFTNVLGGLTLPDSGSTGTMIFYIAGAILALFTAAFVISRKRILIALKVK